MPMSSLVHCISFFPLIVFQIQFGTLKDFFQAVFQRSGLDPSSGQTSVFPSLGGDFFTYADR